MLPVPPESPPPEPVAAALASRDRTCRPRRARCRRRCRWEIRQNRGWRATIVSSSVALPSAAISIPPRTRGVVGDLTGGQIGRRGTIESTAGARAVPADGAIDDRDRSAFRDAHFAGGAAEPSGEETATGRRRRSRTVLPATVTSVSVSVPQRRATHRPFASAVEPLLDDRQAAEGGRHAAVHLEDLRTASPPPLIVMCPPPCR